ncbi:substance-K receptor isoform X2 [Nematostella vectensis]|nr:substance-K receptor isoform X2 [Nematostella vectensis]XP_032238866.2 substance-K receptor isoform X2 [Nematostella vectensis]
MPSPTLSGPLINSSSIAPNSFVPTNSSFDVNGTTLPALDGACAFKPLHKSSIFLLTIAYSSIIVVSAIGNAMVIRHAVARRKLRRSFDRLIINMAVADLLDTIFGVPYNISYFYIGLRWFPGTLGEFTCKFLNFGTNISITASVFTLAAIAVDRYFAIAHCAKRPLSLRSVRYIIATIWVIACMVFSSDYYRFRVIDGPNGDVYCVQDANAWGKKAVQIDYIVKFVLNYAFPLFAMGILYSIMIRYLWQTRGPGYASDSIERRVHEQRKRSVKKLLAIVIEFAFCWFPIHVVHFLAAFNPKLLFCTSVYVPLTCIWLAHANSAINPCLYLYLTHKNRKANVKPSATF